MIWGFLVEIIVVGRRPEQDDFKAREDYASLACAIQNISLYLWKQGVRSKWSTGELTRRFEIYKIIDVSPGNMVLEGFLWMGYPNTAPKAPPKVELEEIYFKTR